MEQAGSMAIALRRHVAEGWFEACEVLLDADPGRLSAIAGGAVSERLRRLLLRLDELGAETGQLDRLRGMAERWGATQPGVAQWFLDYRWLAEQERHHASTRKAAWPPTMGRSPHVPDDPPGGRRT
jgi:hypothetical protein